MTTWLDTPNYVSRSVMPPDDLAALSRLEYARNGDLLATDVAGEAPVGVVSIVGAALAVVLLTASVAVVPSATDFATVTVYKRTLGGAPIPIARGVTSPTGAASMGALPAKIPVAVPPVSPPVAVAYGDAISVAFSKSGAGVILPPLTIDAVMAPSFLDVQLDQWCSWIRDRLRKRYDTAAIDLNPPNTCKRWLAVLVDRECYLRRGFNPSATQDQALLDRATAALAEIKEAADSKDGLIELPMLDTADADAVSKGGPLGYSETSPYVAFDQERCVGSFEDGQGRGTGP